MFSDLADLAVVGEATGARIASHEHIHPLQHLKDDSADNRSTGSCINPSIECGTDDGSEEPARKAHAFDVQRVSATAGGGDGSRNSGQSIAADRNIAGNDRVWAYIESTSSGSPASDRTMESSPIPAEPANTAQTTTVHADNA